MKKIRNILLYLFMPLLATLWSCSSDSDADTTTAPGNYEAQLLSMHFDDERVVTQPVIDQYAATVYFEVADGVTDYIMTPAVEVSEGASVLPLSGTAKDFSNPVTYTVTSRDGRKRSYTVTCRNIALEDKDKVYITKFTLEGEQASWLDSKPVITYSEDGPSTIELFMRRTAPAGSVKLSPVITCTEGATVYPKSEQEVEFVYGEAVAYTVFSQDRRSIHTYNVIVTKEMDSGADILRVSFEGEGANLIGDGIVFRGSGKTNIEVYLREEATAQQIEALAFDIAISDKASIEAHPENPEVMMLGVPFRFTVTSEDGSVVNDYNITCWKRRYWGFESWTDGGKVVRSDGADAPSFEADADAVWASNNAFVSLVMQHIPDYKADCDANGESYFPVNKTSDCRSGNYGVELCSKYTIGLETDEVYLPAMTPAVMFTGEMYPDAEDYNAGFRFGTPFNHKACKVRGYYKYSAGETFYDNYVAVAGHTDSHSIMAVLFEASDDDYLDGYTLFNSKNIVAQARMESGSTMKEYTEFELTLDYNNDNGIRYDNTVTYKLAIVFFASEGGVAPFGAPGSTMIVDDVEVLFE